MNARAADAARLRAALAAQPTDRVSWHNLAAAEGDLGHAAEAEAAARRAIELGIPAPETRLVLARALQSLRKLDEAESMFKKAIALRPAYADAHRDLAQLTWMRTGRTEDALKKLSRALRESPAERRAASGAFRRARIRRRSGGRAGRLRAWVGTHAPNDLPLLRQAAHLVYRNRRGGACLSLSMRAIQLAPADTGAQISLCESLLAAGEPADAEAKAAELCNALPTESIRVGASGDRVEIAG